MWTYTLLGTDAADMKIWFFSVDDRIICLFPIKYVDGE